MRLNCYRWRPKKLLPMRFSQSFPMEGAGLLKGCLSSSASLVRSFQCLVSYHLARVDRINYELIAAQDAMPRST